MNKLNKKLISVFATSAMLLQISSGLVFAGISCTISGNGADADNTCAFTSSEDVDVTQNNVLNVDNDVSLDADTGNNDANKNTGGDTEIETGDVDVDVMISTVGNTNAATVEGSSSSQDFDLVIEDNGANTDNDVDIDTTGNVVIDQDNRATIDNDVDIDADTGRNDANKNTGGDVSITTGDVGINDGVWISTAVNANSASVGSDGDEGTLSATISGNGFDSDNRVDIEVLNEVDVDQDNRADIDNDVDVDADTGRNDANKNTGGDTEIETGDVDVDVTLDTMANFNSADVYGGYVGDVELDIDGNGVDTDNDIDLDLTDNLDVDQDNRADVDNDVTDEADIDTGNNDANKNTGDDTSVETGDVDVEVEINTSGNVNVFGDDLGLNFEVDFSELLDLLSALGSLLGL